jgi:Asp-tRNA(Asn)/Glu-tRNA(Gln) amidotransferase A subunit family amidase
VRRFEARRATTAWWASRRRRGLTSRAGVIAISYTQDRVGVHAKSVEDAALMLTYMRGLCKFAFDAYLRRRGPDTPIASLEELVASGRYHKAFESTFKRALAVESVDFDKDCLARLENRLTIRKVIVGLMDRYQVDALVHPFKSLGAPPIGTGDRGPRDNPVSAITGLPAIVVPAGVDAEGLPISIEFLGRPFSEPTLFNLAFAYEQASHRRTAPGSTPHLAGEVFPY